MGANHAKIDAYRRRSLSDGNLGITAFLETLREGQGYQKDQVKVAIPARELSQPTIAGYLERKDSNGEWTNCWCILKDSTLYRYGSPIDETTDDVIQLPGYTVLLCSGSDGKLYAFELVYPNEQSELFNAESEEVMDHWISQLHLAAQKMTIEGLDLQQGRSPEFDTGSLDSYLTVEECQLQRELVRIKKQQLLEEMLRQKEQLSLELQQKGKMKVHSSMDNLLLSPDVEPRRTDSRASEACSEGDDIIDQYQALKDVTNLKQRKISMQLKVESIQRQLAAMQNKNKKKSKFRLGLNLKGSTPEKTSPADVEAKMANLEELETQLRHLTQDLGTIDKKQAELTAKLKTMSPVLEPLSKANENMPSRGKWKSSELMFSADKKSSSGSDILTKDRSGSCLSDVSMSKMSTRTSSSSLSSQMKSPSVSDVFPKYSALSPRVESPSQSKTFTSDASSKGKIGSPSGSHSRLPVTPEHAKGKSGSLESADRPALFRLHKSVDDTLITKVATTRKLTNTGWQSRSCDVQDGAVAMDKPALSRATSETSGIPKSDGKNTDKAEVSSLGSSQSISSSKKEISPDALAEIAAFEEFIHAKIGNL